MSIQQNINQNLSLVSLLMTQSPQVKARKEALGYQGRQEQAVRGLQDIKSNLRRAELTSRVDPLTEEETAELKSLGGPKTYNEEELKNIEERTSQYQKDIYDAKSAALNPQYRNVIDPQHIKQPELSSQLSRIREMTGKAKEALAAKKIEAQPSKNFVETVMEGVYSPLTDPRKGGF